MDNLRLELAAHAARLIAEDGLDYGSAKRKAAQQVLGGKARISSNLMPDNEEIEEQLRHYQQLFQADTQPQRLRELRLRALELMHCLQEFDPWLTGAVWNGTAGEHSEIRLELYTGSGKEVAIHLLNQGLAFESGVSPHFSGQGEIEALRLEWQNEEVLLFIYGEYDLRSRKNGAQPQKRGRIEDVKLILAEVEQ